MNITFDNANEFVVNEPIILLSVQQMTSSGDTFYFATTTYSNSNTSFALNFYPINPSGTGNVKLLIKYLAFERITLLDNVAQDNDISNVLISGPLMDEVQQSFKAGYAQTFRVFNIDNPDLHFVDNRVHIGPIDEGAEFITKYTTKLSSENEYFTNQAGLEYVKRVYYPYWDERIAANYYPSSGATFIKDMTEDVRFSTIVNQGHGVGSLKDGEFEMMLQRRLLEDDHRGVDEVLNETYHTEPQIMILLDNAENVANLNRRYYQIQQFAHSFFFGMTSSIEAYVSEYNTSWTAMNLNVYPNGLPENIFLMQLRYAYSGQNVGDNGGMVMQIQHMFEDGESSMAKEETIDLSKILKSKVLTLRNSTEMNLLSFLPLANLERLPWNVEMENGEIVRIRDEESEEKRRRKQLMMDKASTVQMKPRDIRTYVLNCDPDVPTDEFIK